MRQCLEVANGVGESGRLLTMMGYSVQVRFPHHQAGGEGAMYSIFFEGGVVVPVGLGSLWDKGVDSLCRGLFD